MSGIRDHLIGRNCVRRAKAGYGIKNGKGKRMNEIITQNFDYSVIDAKYQSLSDAYKIAET
jgi:hypothetical protein